MEIVFAAWVMGMAVLLLITTIAVACLSVFEPIIDRLAGALLMGLALSVCGAAVMTCMTAVEGR